MQLDGNYAYRGNVGEDEIDGSSRGSTDQDLRQPRPSRAEDGQHGSGHGVLDPIVDPWSGGRKQPDAKIRAENLADRHEHLDGRISGAGFDPRYESLVDGGGCGESPLADARIQAQAPNFFTNRASERARTAPDERPIAAATSHQGSEAARASRAITRQFTDV